MKFTTPDERITVLGATVETFPCKEAGEDVNGYYSRYYALAIQCQNNLTDQPFTVHLRMPEHVYRELGFDNAELILRASARWLDAGYKQRRGEAPAPSDEDRALLGEALAYIKTWPMMKENWRMFADIVGFLEKGQPIHYTSLATVHKTLGTEIARLNALEKYRAAFALAHALDLIQGEYK